LSGKGAFNPYQRRKSIEWKGSRVHEWGGYSEKGKKDSSDVKTSATAEEKKLILRKENAV